MSVNLQPKQTNTIHKKKNMYLVFTVSLLVIGLTSAIYVLNEKKIREHVRELSQLEQLKQKLMTFREDRAKTFTLGQALLPTCMGAYVFDRDLGHIVWRSIHSTVAMEPSIIDPITKQTILVRAMTGGGLVHLPWRQRMPDGKLKNVTASVFSIGREAIGVVILCD